MDGSVETTLGMRSEIVQLPDGRRLTLYSEAPAAGEDEPLEAASPAEVG